MVVHQGEDRLFNELAKMMVVERGGEDGINGVNKRVSICDQRLKALVPALRGFFKVDVDHVIRGFSQGGRRRVLVPCELGAGEKKQRVKDGDAQVDSAAA